MTTPTVREVVTARKQYLLDREMYKITGEGFGKMGAAYARWRALERHHIKGTTPPKRHIADFENTVAGIPCGVVVTHWGVDRPAVLRADPADSQPPEYESPEWFLVDRRGYAALWLMEKLVDDDYRRIDDMVLRGKDQCD